MDLKYGMWFRDRWWILTVDSVDVGSSASLVLDDRDDAHICYELSGLKYAKGPRSSWMIEEVDTNAGRGHSSIALDMIGRPHLSYFRDVTRDLVYAKKFSSGEWKPEVVDYIGGVGMWTSLAMDSESKPHISFHATSEGLKYASKSELGPLPKYDPRTILASSDSPSAGTSANGSHGISGLVYDPLLHVANETSPTPISVSPGDSGQGRKLQQMPIRARPE